MWHNFIAIILFVYLPSMFFGMYVYRAHKAELTIVIHKGFLLGVSYNEDVLDDESYHAFQITLGPVLFTFNWSE